MATKIQEAAWTMERKLTIGGIVSILMLSGSMFAVYSKVSDRLSSMETAMTYQRGVNDQLRDNLKENKADTVAGLGEVKSSIKDLSNKVDRLADRLVERK